LTAATKRHIDFRYLVEQHQERVRNTCFRFVKNPQDADDVAQDVFIQVYESLSHFREDAELSTWIYRIAVNKSLDFIRKQKRKKRFAQLTSILGFGDDEDNVELPAAGDPLRDLENKERKQVLDWAIDKLPDNQKSAITLSKYEGFSNKEIADILDISVSAVEALIHRAKNNLNKQLYHYFDK
jgi:RNA polymerase sigma-70 factor (ECF subfamily)